ncbi:sigma-54-dependent Fis family transcriptional regulator [Rhodomicrobium lacus]|uniref:sigma-54-dependent Fis family transcriptional regulator n=1 Tax=Rhodomicrobium lacus TaxID=2498452 RepID=UPI0026E23990|nr:sigma-54-dependent Fis family transcriptional regulator [Rhodomicrobium lacus]WKW49984.1 sigma-54-dependent Fis family transcriptional regulator [Rhodomicrobium lacus]
MNQRAIRLAWEEFQQHGRKACVLPRAIAASWERSRSFGVGTALLRAPLADEAEIFRRRSLNASFLAASRHALERSREMLRDAASMMILADRTGFVLETAGDGRVVEQGKGNALQTGGAWQENAIGTNAIGTALAEQRPVKVTGAEHFCEDVQRWSCAAAPVHHPLDGELLGAVDISGPVATFNPQSLALAAAIGREIEATLEKAAKLDHEILLRHLLSKRSTWLSEDILVIDRRGHLVHSTETAMRKIDTASPDDLPHVLRRIIGSASAEAWERNCRDRFPNAGLEIVEDDGEVAGCLIVLLGKRSIPASPAVARAPRAAADAFDEIAGESAVMRDIRERARKLAANPLPVLIEGETGVGKELFARAIKAASACASGPFVPVNCGGMARDLIASELFGYVKGAFTGADGNGRPGKIEKADGGILCLDEIGEMPMDLQSYLLRVLEDGIVYRVGDHEGRPVSIRLVSMTNRDLMEEVGAGRFRRDLFYRIAAARLRIPPLRERGDDVLVLAERFAARTAARLGRPSPSFSADALMLLRLYGWPGNVRELRNVIDAVLALCETDKIDVEHLPPEMRLCDKASRAAGAEPEAAAKPLTVLPSRRGMKTPEREAILAEVEACGGNLTEAARRLGIARSTLYVRLAKYGVLRSPED